MIQLNFIYKYVPLTVLVYLFDCCNTDSFCCWQCLLHLISMACILMDSIMSFSSHSASLNWIRITRYEHTAPMICNENMIVSIKRNIIRDHHQIAGPEELLMGHTKRHGTTTSANIIIKLPSTINVHWHPPLALLSSLLPVT